MTWVWHSRLDTRFRPAEFDYDSPITMNDASSDVPLDLSRGKPILRTRSRLEVFERLHCPPTGRQPAVDSLWKEIILRFVPQDLVQFYPIDLVAKDGVSHKFFWVIPFGRVKCIDLQRSDIDSKVEKNDKVYIISCRYYVHCPNCLGELHLARDERQFDHIVLSDELRNALAETGESGMFFWPEDIPKLFGRSVH